MQEKIEKYLDLLCTMTQEEAEFVYDVLHWGDEDKMAFLLAKQIFEEEIADQ